MDLTGKIEVGLRSRCRSPRGRKSKSEKITFCTVGTMWACCNNSYPESRVHSRGRRIPKDVTKDIGANEPVLSTSAALFAANNRAFCFFFATRTAD